MKIIDSFIFFNELDILEIRLEELYDVVDYFILVEGNLTFTGKNKELFYENNKKRYEKYCDKIIHIILNDYPITNDPWVREKYQRNQINNGIKKLELNDDDIIIISDVDEIPNSDILSSIKNLSLLIEKNLIYSLVMILYYYSIEYTTERLWYHVKLLSYYKYIQYNLPENIRCSPYDKLINNGGWHISYYGDSNFIINKLESFSEQQANNSRNKDINFLNECLINGLLFFNNEQLIKISKESNNNLPKELKNKIKNI
jgi:beta-1,4-mannosyl-glycoprotein beta-1,4-N-acetylglucosaminyltransferase